jgi:hypothetical protein
MSVDPPRVELFAHGNEDDVKKPLRAGRPDLVKQDTIARGPRWQPYFAVTVEMVPSLEMTPEWYAVTSSPYYEQWKKNLDADNAISATSMLRVDIDSSHVLENT